MTMYGGGLGNKLGAVRAVRAVRCGAVRVVRGSGKGVWGEGGRGTQECPPPLSPQFDFELCRWRLTRKTNGTQSVQNHHHLPNFWN